MKKRVLCLLLAVITIFSMSMGAAAIQLRWSALTSIQGSLDISTGGTASTCAVGTAVTTGIDKITVTASLQQFKNSAWTEVKAWSASRTGQTCTIEKDWPVAHGYSYRLVITAKAYTGSSLRETGSYTVDYGYFK